MSLRTILVGCFLLFVGTAWAEDPTAAEWIEQLGDPRYSERVEAQRQLVAAGLGAFDALLEATEHRDPEIAAVSRRLLAQITEPWPRPGDSRHVRRLLEDYGSLSLEERLDTIRAIDQTEGAHALCRIVRFDPSPRVSREAAQELLAFPRLKPSDYQRPPIAKAIAQLDAQYDVSARLAIQWLRLAANADTSAAQWLVMVQRESTTLAQQPSKTDRSVVASLVWHQLLATVREANHEDMLETTNVLLKLEEQNPLLVVRCIATWLADRKDWDGVDALLAEHAELLTGRRGLYLRAKLLADRGSTEPSEALALQAFELSEAPPQGLFGERVIEADTLLQTGQTEWALRELTEASRTLDPLSADAAYARWKLADTLQDDERYAEAAAALAGLEEVVTSREKRRRQYRELTQQVSLLRSQRAITTRRWLYAGLALRAEGKPGELAALDRAIQADPSDADVLIALHQVSEQSAAKRRLTQKRIRALCQRFELAIASDPSDPTPYNQWAWLVANTEGDFAKAVRYSRRSLDLSPDNAGFLDTLGRCLYSAGDFEEAVATQRRAVEQMPTMRVMQRQLELFEAALQESQGNSRQDAVTAE